MVIASAVVARPQTLHTASKGTRLQSDLEVIAHDDCCDTRPADDRTATSPAGDIGLRSSHPAAPSAVQKPALSPSTASDTRFKARQSFHDLLDAVRDVAIAATGCDASAAAHLSQGKWNRQRALMNRLDLPTAESVRQRMRKGCSWARTLEVALAPAGERLTLLNRLQSTPVAYDGSDQMQSPRVLSDRATLRSVFNVLQHSPSQVEYAAVAFELARQHRRKRSAQQLRRPVAATIRAHHKTWAAALSAAGLPPQRDGRAVITTGQDPADVLDKFIDENGFLPVQRYFWAWARQQAIPLPRRAKQDPLSVTVARVRARRNARAVWTPSKAMRRSACPKMEMPGPRTVYTHQDRLRCLRRYAEQLRATGRRPSTQGYQEASARDPLLMAFHTLTQDGQFRFQDLCQEAGIA